MYVIKPVVPLSGIFTPSYNPWATDIVFLIANPNFLEASCCIVLVVNGGAGFLFFSPVVTSSTINFAFSKSCNILSTSSFEWSSIFSLFFPKNFDSKDFLVFVSESIAVIFQYSSGTKCSISSSLSHISLTATDCTLPADNPLFTFFQSTGLILYPTILSNTLLACWASVKFKSIFLGFLTASLTASLVISLKVILQIESCGIPKMYAKCHAIASPSRSGSVARYTCFEFLASFFNEFIKLAFPRIFIYSGSKSCSVSIASLDLGKSLICPIDATTFVFPPRNFLIVFAFAGDSTIINLSVIFFLTSFI